MLTPPTNSYSSYLSSWILKTPRDLRQFECQSRTVQKYLKYYTISPETPAKQALSQLIKGYYLAIYNIILLVDENAALRTANQR